MTVIAELSADSIASIQLVAPESNGTGDWAIRRVMALWLSANEEAPETGPLIFSLAGMDGVYDCHHRRVAERESPRDLLFQQRG